MVASLYTSFPLRQFDSCIETFNSCPKDTRYIEIEYEVHGYETEYGAGGTRKYEAPVDVSGDTCADIESVRRRSAQKPHAAHGDSRGAFTCIRIEFAQTATGASVVESTAHVCGVHDERGGKTDDGDSGDEGRVGERDAM